VDCHGNDHCHRYNVIITAGFQSSADRGSDIRSDHPTACKPPTAPGCGHQHRIVARPPRIRLARLRAISRPRQNSSDSTIAFSHSIGSSAADSARNLSSASNI
jgi:hypothetical protein